MVECLPNSRMWNSTQQNLKRGMWLLIFFEELEDTIEAFTGVGRSARKIISTSDRRRVFAMKISKELLQPEETQRTITTFLVSCELRFIVPGARTV